MKDIPAYKEFRKLMVEVSYSMGLLSTATVDFRLKYSKCFDISILKRVEILKKDLKKGDMDSKRVILALKRIERNLKKRCEDDDPYNAVIPVKQNWEKYL